MVSKRTMRKRCVFCEIANGTDVEAEIKDEVCEVFNDHKYPHARYHFLCVLFATKWDLPRILCTFHAIVFNSLSFGFHRPPFNSIHHLHMHIVGPVTEMRYHIAFDPRLFIFIPVGSSVHVVLISIQVDKAIRRIQGKKASRLHPNQND
ncbi:unnamed protein product [Echinostoma caproni]|uniref:HIT domain-containing protein n=1 Tax=Echinostoma caproni TaxID=27848 RepID=A0A183B4R0_9TREM|nr:unnamed protein product [Echinostoma caproni]